MKLSDKITYSFAGYGIIFGAILTATVIVAFYIAEDAILDHFLSLAVHQAVGESNDPLVPKSVTVYTDNAPPEFTALPEGRHEVGQYRHVAVLLDPDSDSRSYVVLDETAAGFDRVLARILFATMLVLLVVVIAGIAIARVISSNLMRPVDSLVNRIDELDIADPRLEPLATEDEIGFLSERFSAAVDLIGEHDRRERDFTRFASHELRSPVTVLRGTTSILRTEDSLTERGRRALSRSEMVIERMSRLIEAFLYLGRSKNEVVRTDMTSGELAAEIRRLVELQGELGYKLNLILDSGSGSFSTNPMLLSLVLENLVANAARHGTGEVSVRIRPPEIAFTNEVAHDTEEGHRFGLEIATRVCEQLGLELRIDSDPKVFVATIVAPRNA